MNLGIIQGRLSEPVGGHYQEFPNNWEREFKILDELLFSGIEWLITKKHYKNNPILQNASCVEKYPIISICMDTLVDSKIIEKHYLKTMLDDFCSFISGTHMNLLTIPLLDESDLNEKEKRSVFCDLIKPIGDKYPNIKFAFEAELSTNKLQEIIKLCDNFYVTYDTGNITSHGLNHCDYINFFADKIMNVHIKDRTYSAETVEPLTGDTDFNLIFKTLRDIDYRGPFILQTARSITGQETQTMKRHKKIFEKLYEKYF